MEQFRIELKVWSSLIGERPPEGDPRWETAYCILLDNNEEHCTFDKEKATLVTYERLDELNLFGLATRCRNFLRMADWELGSVNIIKLIDPEFIHINITIDNDPEEFGCLTTI